MNLTPHTYDEWPVYLMQPLFSWGHGYLKSLIFPKSSHDTKHLPSLERSVAFTSSPSEHYGQIPYTYHPYIHVHVAQDISFAVAVSIAESVEIS